MGGLGGGGGGIQSPIKTKVNFQSKTLDRNKIMKILEEKTSIILVRLSDFLSLAIAEAESKPFLLSSVDEVVMGLAPIYRACALNVD